MVEEVHVLRVSVSVRARGAGSSCTQSVCVSSVRARGAGSSCTQSVCVSSVRA